LAPLLEVVLTEHLHKVLVLEVLLLQQELQELQELEAEAVAVVLSVVMELAQW
jgi:hypothetical protein